VPLAVTVNGAVPLPILGKIKKTCDKILIGLQIGVKHMDAMPKCPKCNSEYTYNDGTFFVCPECAHEWSNKVDEKLPESVLVIKDAHGNILQDGDTVTIIKDLKVKGSSLVVKVGTKVKNIRLVEGDHNIDCKIDGIGSMKLKSEFVKKT
jgi:protein PhnA